MYTLLFLITKKYLKFLNDFIPCLIVESYEQVLFVFYRMRSGILSPSVSY